MTDPMQAALTEDVVRLTQERDSLADQVSQLGARLAEEQIRNGKLVEELAERDGELARVELERDMAYDAYSHIRSEYMALTFEPTDPQEYPVAPQLEDTFPEASDNS